MPEKPLDKFLKDVKKLLTGWCPTCHKEAAIISKVECKAKKCGITIKSAKQKARRAQQDFAEIVRGVFNLAPEDIESVTMGVSGQDIKLSEKARACWPFHAIEITASPNVSLHAKYAQAQRHAEKQMSGKVPGNGKPIVAFKRNGTGFNVVLSLDDLLWLINNERKKAA